MKLRHKFHVFLVLAAVMLVNDTAEATGTANEALDDATESVVVATFSLGAFALWLKTATQRDDTYALDLEEKLRREDVLSVEV